MVLAGGIGEVGGVMLLRTCLGVIYSLSCAFTLTSSINITVQSILLLLAVDFGYTLPLSDGFCAYYVQVSANIE